MIITRTLHEINAVKRQRAKAKREEVLSGILVCLGIAICLVMAYYAIPTC